MATKIGRSPRELVRLAGKVPGLVIAAALIAAAPLPVFAQGTPAGDKKDGPQVKVSDHLTVDLHVKDEDLGAVLELLSIQSQKNIVASKNVSARVTATLYNVTFKEALDALLHVNGFGYIEQGNFIYVYTLQELEEIQKALKKRVAKPIYLNYMNAQDAGMFVKPLLSKEGELHATAKAETFAVNDKTPVGKDDNAQASVLVVIDYEENIAAIEALVGELDIKPAQVLVEATILQTALNEANAFGVDFTVLGDLSFLDFISTGGPLSAVNSLIKGGDGSAGQGYSPPDNKGVAVTQTVGNTAAPGGMKFGIISDDVSVFIRVLDEISQTVIVSHPKVLALNRQASRVLVGRRVGYLSTVSSETSTTQTVSFLDTGVQLNFRPFVAKDNSIRLEIRPQVSEAVVRDQTSNTGTVVSIPDEITQEITTNIIVKDGQTVVLGGLFRENTQLTRRQVPIVGDLPYIGAAFQGNEDQIDRTEIIFLITPKLINDAIVTEFAQRATEDIERLQVGARQALLPFSREKMCGTLNVEAETLARDGQYEKALWTIQRSLSLNHVQPDAIALREKLTQERQYWPTKSVMEDAVNEEVKSRFEQVNVPAEQPQPKYVPWGETDIPLYRTTPLPAPAEKAPEAQSSTEPNEDMAMFGAPEGDHNQMWGDPLPLVNVWAQNKDIRNVLSQISMQSRVIIVADPDVTGTVSADLQGVNVYEALDTILPANGFAYVEQDGVVTVKRWNRDHTQNAMGNQPAASPVNPDAQAKFPPLAPVAAAAEPAPAPAPAMVAAPEGVRFTISTTLAVLRGQIGAFREFNEGHLPPLSSSPGDTGWEAFVAAGMMQTPPVNPWVDGPNASTVVMGTGPDSGYHNGYGWILDPTSGKVWAASCDDKGNPLPKANTNPTETASGPQSSAEPVRPTTDLPLSLKAMFAAMGALQAPVANADTDTK
ncbi:MAG: hypothetical protein KF745_04305 [Phycisphaeraceae bacterium]|nr:hypothetical protein [Phycisphaeraceae bacterium]